MIVFHCIEVRCCLLLLFSSTQTLNWEFIGCPTKAFTYASKPDFVSSSTTVKPSSTGADQCVPINVQLDASVGTYLFSGYVTASTSNGVTSNAATTLDSCVTACAQDPDCYFSEFRYNDQSGDYTPGCFLFAPATIAGAGSSSNLAVCYKLPPTLDVSAASVQAASVRSAGLSTSSAATVTETSGSSGSSSSSRGVVRAQSVVSGLYVKHSYAATVTLPFDSANLQTESSLSAAAAACDMSAACWGIVEVSAGSYALKAGNDLVGARTVVNAMKSDEATGTASSRIVQP